MGVKEYLVLGFFVSAVRISSGLRDSKPASIRPGRTPGVPPPGHPSYLSETCKIVPEISEEWIPNFRLRKLLSKQVRRKARVDAWKRPHLDQSDFLQMEKLIDKAESFCPFMTKDCVQPKMNYSMAMIKHGKKKINLSPFQLRNGKIYL